MRPESRCEQFEYTELHASAIQCLKNCAERIGLNVVRECHDRELILINYLEPFVADSL